MTMRQLTFVKPGTVEWHEVMRPKLRSDVEAIVRPFASSTCDVDQAIIRGASPLEGSFAIGHEAVAEVVEVGDGCKSVSPGDVVIVPWHVSCGDCQYCDAGLPTSCEKTPDYAMYGWNIGGDWGGLFDDYVRVPYADAMLYKIPDGVDPHHCASFSDNVAIGWEVLKKHLERKPGAEVLVAGGSASICLYVADVAHALGAKITYVDPSQRRCDIARQIGVKVIKGLPESTMGEFDFAIDASANPESLHKVLTMLKPHSHCESVGIYFDDTPLPLYDMYMRGVTFHIGRGNARNQMPHILDLKKRGCIHPEHAHTAIHSYEEIPEAIVASAKPLFIRERETN